ncbi:MAG: hypothetical protein ACJAW4_003626 [Paracoccaceae bacterium]|jgi:hypothetical protein
MDRIEGESVWLRSLAFADELIGRQPAESLQSTGVVIRVDEIREMSRRWLRVIVMKAFDVWRKKDPLNRFLTHFTFLDCVTPLTGKSFLSNAGEFAQSGRSFRDASPS